MAADKPILSKRAFPDIDMDSIDYQKDSLNVMERVIQQGKSTDFDELLRFYGRERIRKEIIHTKDMDDDKCVNFCCVVFNLNFSDFLYYVRKPRIPRTEAETYNHLYPYNIDGEFIGDR